MGTREPVTLGGWYENTDGTVSLYRWDAGRLVLVQTVASWADVSHAEPTGPTFDEQFGARR